MRQILLLALIFQLSFSMALAQSDTSSFYIRVFGSEDIIPPSTPTLTAATAISHNQVDVTWSTATDNFMVSGYVLYRDGTPLATTTLTNYSDNGVVASTTYSYAVRAFDPSNNYSSSSNTLLVTTPDPPAPPVVEEDESNQTTAARVVLDGITVTPNTYDAKIALNTARPARFEIRWGRTNAYELGYTITDSFARSYTTTLTGLQPGTKYQYEVLGFTPFGASTVLKQGTFTTTGLADGLAPANVSQFIATVNGKDVALSWTMPAEEFSYVRVVRSHVRFPTSLSDGVIVYQGTNTRITDVGALQEYSPMYYTVFVVDAAGNTSSGAVARVYAVDDATVPGQQPPIHNGGPLKDQATESASTSPSLPPGTRMPSLAEIFVQQENTRLSLATPTITLDADQPFAIVIPVESITENLKTIIGSITDPTDTRQSFSFILRLNNDGTAYEAVLSALTIEGQSRLIIDVYDYESRVMATYQKSIIFGQTKTDNTPVFPDTIVNYAAVVLPAVGGIGIGALLLYFFFKRRRHADEDNG